MTIYYLLFLLALCAGHRPFRESQNAIVLVAVAMAVIVGIRFEVGADWETYLRTYHRTENFDLSMWYKVSTDPAYAGLNYISNRFSFGMLGVNLVCASIMMFGIAWFAQTHEDPWLVFVAATPYLVIVVGMGYTRQSVAVGLELMALVALFDKKQIRFILFVVAAGAFHKSAFILLPLGCLGAERRGRWQYVLLIVGVTAGFYFLLRQETTGYVENYIESKHYSSGGALIRLAMSAVASAISLFFHRQFFDNNSERFVWGTFALVTFLALGLTQFSTTAADRLGIYLIPIQMFVCGRINRLSRNNGIALIAVIAYALTLVVWINYATHAFAWIPYQISPAIYQDQL